jgi:hypothetical protein
MTATLVLLMACSVRLSAGVYGDDIPGATVEKSINDRILLNLRGELPQHKFSEAKCPERINLSGGKVAHCSFTIDGVSIPVRIVYEGPDPQGFKANLEGFIFPVPMVEKYADSAMRQYNFQAVAHCGPPAIRVYPAGTNFYCAVSGVPHTTRLHIKTTTSGQLFFFRPDAVPIPAAEQWMGDALHEHKLGQATIVNGQSTAAYIDQSIEADMSAAPASGAVGKARCPARLDLSGKSRATCLVAFSGSDARFTVWIDDAVGFRVRRADAIIDKATVERLAMADLNRRLVDNGNPPGAVVVCGRGFIVVKPPGVFYCRLAGDGLTGKLQVSVSDWRGTMRWRGVGVKQH